MKKQDLQKIRSKTSKEILEELARNEKELKEARSRMQGEIRNMRIGKALRRNIAQMKTVLKELESNVLTGGGK